MIMIKIFNLYPYHQFQYDYESLTHLNPYLYDVNELFWFHLRLLVLNLILVYHKTSSCISDNRLGPTFPFSPLSPGRNQS